MNLVQLKYFKEVARSGTISAAARQLHISQPSLSVAIKELENEFSLSLFFREKRGMRLTKAGEALLELAENLLSSADKAERIMKDMCSGRKVIKLGIPPMLGSLFLPGIYQSFLTLNPDISLDITEMGREKLLKHLDDGFIDTAIIPHISPIDLSYETEHVCKLEIICCASKKNPLAKLDKINISDLSDVPLVLFENGFFQTEEIKKRFKKAGILPKILLQTSQLSTLLRIISSNIAVGFMFRELMEENEDICEIKMNDALCIEVSLVRKKGESLPGNIKFFKEYICNIRK